MKNLLIIIIVFVVGTFPLKTTGSGANFSIPPVAAGNQEGNIKGIKQYEYLDLFEKAKPTSKLAVKDHYTIVEGYTDTCYNFNHAVLTEESVSVTNCGTPHVEIYGPDKNLIATDKCGEKNYEEGLAFINNWLKAELN